jgi:hypothetical protein
MLNHTVRAYLPVFQDQLRTSVLGRATGRKWSIQVISRNGSGATCSAENG